MFRYLSLMLAVTALLRAAPEYRAGTASLGITPLDPIRLSGYGSRTRPSEGVLTPIYAKALALARGKNERLIIVTADVIGLPRAITDVAAARIQQKYGLDRSELLFNASHTHTGPYVRGNLPRLFEIGPTDKAAIDAWADRLTDALVEVVGRAILDVTPARLDFAHGQAHFAVNRRQPTEKGIIIGLNPTGPTDPDVPVLRITGEDGKLRAVIFGYACHNTTLTGEHNQISGDYAGYAAAAIEKANPGATAMFLMLSGADQNPNPRGTVDLAQRHGTTLASEVQRVMAAPMTPLHGSIKSAYRITELEFRDADRPLLELQMRRYPYPVQAIAFGPRLTLVALGGEVVVDYALRIRKEFPGTVVAGYSNDVMAYIPSLRVSKEGGYEVVDSMRYYGLPAPWADNTEERIMTTVRTVIRAVK